MTIVERIKSLCKEKGITFSGFEVDSGIGLHTVARWDKVMPSIEKVQKAAAYFGITVSELIGENEKTPTLSGERGEKEQQIINLYVNLPQDKRAIAMNLLKALAAEDNNAEAPDP